jgi:transcription termination factor NusB
MTVQIDDAGVGDLLYGVVVGAHRKETGEFHYDLIPVSYFQSPSFGRKMYLKKATELALQLLYQMKIGENEEIEICSSFLFDETRPHLVEKFGKTRVKTSIITGDAQNNVETAYLDEIRNLGYEPLPERDQKRARSFFHMLKWVKNDPERLRYAKTGWPRLRRYMKIERSTTNKWSPR